MFGQGAYDLVDFAMEKWYDQLKVELDDLDLSGIDLKGRLKVGIKTRLSYQIPYQKHWPSAMSIGLHPYYFKQTLSRVHKISDHLWYVSGDNSLDINWYTKRAALSTVYCATELYMAQDNSSNFRDTWEFLDDRIGNVISTGTTMETTQYAVLGVAKSCLTMATAFSPEPSYTHSADKFDRMKEMLKRNNVKPHAKPDYEDDILRNTTENNHENTNTLKHDLKDVSNSPN